MEPKAEGDPAQRIELLPDGRVFHYWGGTRQETAQLQAEAADYGDTERAEGTWRIEGDVVIAVFLLGKEWYEHRGEALRTMRARFSKGSLEATYEIDNPDFGEVWGTPDVLVRTESADAQPTDRP
jgi:hypothetical protein